MNNPKPVMPDVSQVRVRARAEWEKSMRRRQGIQERVGASVPFWLIGIAAVFYLLSAPHTAATFDLLTPGWGWSAPIGVELGTVYVAFRRYQLRRQSRRTPWTIIILGVMVVGIAVIVNGAGALATVVSNVGLAQLPFQEIVIKFVELPVTSQVGLVLVPMAAIVIPLGSLVAGEGLAALIFERREQGDFVEQEWQRVKVTVEFEALFNAAVQNGVRPDRAESWARQIAAASIPALIAPELPSGENSQPSAENSVQMDESDSRTVRYAYDKGEAHWQEHPESHDLSARLFAHAAGIGKSTAAEVLSAHPKATPNGNHNHTEE